MIVIPFLPMFTIYQNAKWIGKKSLAAKLHHYAHRLKLWQMSRFMGPTLEPPGSCRPQMGPMLASGSFSAITKHALFASIGAKHRCSISDFISNNKLHLVCESTHKHNKLFINNLANFIFLLQGFLPYMCHFALVILRALCIFHILRRGTT